ncbi:MAG: META domain-containing protein [Chryseolinea sp.]
MKNTFVFLLLICLLQLVQACEEEAATVSDDKQPDDEIVDSTDATLFDTEWLLVDYKINHLPANLKNKALLVLEGGPGDPHSGGGKSFLNWYYGSFSVDEEKHLIHAVGELTRTLVGGTDLEIEVEQAYFRNLKQTKSYDLAGNNLILQFKNGEVGYFVAKK